MKDSLLRYAATFIVAAALTIGFSTPPVRGDILARPDGRRLRLGEFEYRNVSGGKIVGEDAMSIRLAESPSRYEFRADAKFSSGFHGFSSQHWECVTTPALQPVSARLTFGNATQPPVFAITYAVGRVTGFVLNRKGPDAGKRRSVDAALPAGTFDQRVDWATVLASPLAPGRRFEFNVYDPSLGVSHADAKVGAALRVRVPAGSFDVYSVVYRIAKSTGTETYKVFVTRASPRMLVREDFQNGVVGELVNAGR